MAAWRLVSGLGGLARERYRGETKTLCSVEKLPAEGRPGLACLELPTAVVKSGRPRTRSARSSRIASVPTDAARRGCVACDFLVATADREDFLPHARLPKLPKRPVARQTLPNTSPEGRRRSRRRLQTLGEDSFSRCRVGYFPHPFVRFPLVTFGLSL